jgi:DNA-binding GntR family transcriptional regulator
MPPWLKVLVAIVCLILVVAICIAPQLDLPETINRAFHFALLVLVGLAAAAWIVAQAFHQLSQIAKIAWEDRSELSSEWHAEHNCVSRC